MTALAQEKKIEKYGDQAVPNLLVVPVAASTKCYLGGLAVANASGYAAPGSTALNLTALGVFEDTFDNSGSAVNGAISARIRQGAFKFVNSSAGDAIAQADVGQLCYIVDDQTVAKTHAGGTRSVAGRIVQVDSDGVIVQVGIGIDARSSAPLIQTGTVTLVAGTVTKSTGVTITSASKIFLQLNTPSGATQGVKYKVPDASLVTGAPGTGAFAVTAVDNAGATVATDVSTVNYLIVG